MSNIHAHARTREAAADWLAQSKPLSDAVLNGHQRQRIFDAFAAGAIWAITPQSQDDVNQIVAGVIRDAQAAGTDEAADDAALAIFAYLGAIHREEQDQWAEERQIGQRQLDDAGVLMRETAELLRGYEASHRAKEQAAKGERGALAAEEAEARRAKAERNALAAARLEAWLRGEDRYPVAVEHRQSAGQIAEAINLADWTPVPGMPEPTKVVDLTPRTGPDRVAGEMVPGEDTVVAHGEPTAPWRLEGVADLAAFRLTTGDPSFDPAAPVTINGFRYVPAKENEHG